MFVAKLDRRWKVITMEVRVVLDAIDDRVSVPISARAARHAFDERCIRHCRMAVVRDGNRGSNPHRVAFGIVLERVQCD